MEENHSKFRIPSNDQIPFPSEALPSLSLATKKSIVVLLYIIKCNMEEFDAERICELTGYDLETVEESYHYWVQSGVIIENEEDALKSLVESKLILFMHKQPKRFEVDRIINTFKASHLELSVLSEIFELGIMAQKTNPVWIEGVIKICENEKDPIGKCKEMRDYFILSREIIEYLRIERQLTSNEKDIIYKWAQRKIPIDTICDLAEKSKNYTKRLSFYYIDSIIEKMAKKEKIN